MSSSVPLTFWNVPYKRNPYFTGREDVIAQLHRDLRTENAVGLSDPQGISGLGGIGKTQTALEYAYRYRNEYNAIFWVQSESLTTLISSLLDIATILHLPECHYKDAEVTIQAVMHWLRNNRNWLLIYDNIDDLTLAEPFLPTAYSGHLLLTTRAQSLGNLAQRLDIEKMALDTGSLLLLRRAALIALDARLERATSDEQQYALAISQALNGLPLAIDQAGAYIKEAPCPLARYLTLYQTRRSDLLHARGHFNQNYPESVATTWSLAFEKVNETNEAAVELLRFGAYLAPDAIPETIFQGAYPIFSSPWVNSPLQNIATDPLALDDSMRTLLRYSLVTRHEDTSAFSIHRLVQAVILDEATDSETNLYLNMKVIPALRHIFPDLADVQQWKMCAQYLPHILVCAEWVLQKKISFDTVSMFLYEAGCYAQEQGHYLEAEQLYNVVLKMWKRADKDLVAVLFNRLGMVSQMQGNYQQAETFYRKAKARLRGRSEDVSWLREEIEDNIVELHRVRGNYQQAESAYRSRSVQQKEPVAEPDRLSAATSLNNLANLRLNQGKYHEALTLHQQVLALRKTLLGDDHPAIATSLNNLARCHYSLEQYAEAESLYLQALTIMERYLDADHPALAFTFNNLGELYRTLEQYNKAEDYYKRALEIRDKQPANPLRAHSLNGLGMLYGQMGQHEKGAIALQQALAIQEQYLDHNHPDRATTLDNLGACKLMQGKLAEAEACCVRALAIRKRLLREKHPDLAWSLHNLAAVYHMQEKYAKAAELYLDALEIREQYLPLLHQDRALTLNNLGEVFRAQGRHKEAEEMFLRAISIYVHPERPPHPGLAKTLNNLALLCQTLEKHQQALQFYQCSLATTEMLMGNDHPDLIPTLSNLASLYQTLGEQTQAEALYQRASAISEKRLGTEHPQTQPMHESYTSPLQMPSDSDKQNMWQRLLRRIGR